MTCKWVFHIYDMNSGEFGKIVSKHFSYKDALTKLKELEEKNNGSHDYVIL